VAAQRRAAVADRGACQGAAASGEGGGGRLGPSEEEEGLLHARGIERRCTNDGESRRVAGGGRRSAAWAGLGFHGEDEMRPRERERGRKGRGHRGGVAPRPHWTSQRPTVWRHHRGRPTGVAGLRHRGERERERGLTGGPW
jgi:hypothetical protein